MTAPQRISVVGNSGSGKTTLARLIASRLGVRHVELDALYHGPNWTPVEPARFEAAVRGVCETNAWVIDGNYNSVRPIVWNRAEAVVWIDLPRSVVMRQLAWRSLSRLLRRTELWNGNREQWANLLHWDQNKSLLRWAWTQHAAYGERYQAAMHDPANAHLVFRRVASHLEAEALIESFAPGVTSSVRGE